MQMVPSENAIFAAQIFPISDPANGTTYFAKVEVVRRAGEKDVPGAIEMRGFETRRQALLWLADRIKQIEPTADNDH